MSIELLTTGANPKDTTSMSSLIDLKIFSATGLLAVVCTAYKGYHFELSLSV